MNSIKSIKCCYIIGGVEYGKVFNPLTPGGETRRTRQLERTVGTGSDWPFQNEIDQEVKNLLRCFIFASEFSQRISIKVTGFMSFTHSVRVWRGSGPTQNCPLSVNFD